MKNLLREWNRIKYRYSGKHIFLFLDYDGTLSPIADMPQLARTPSSTSNALVRLSDIPCFTVSIISGRSIKSLKSKIRIKNAIYAGNHGLEISGGQLFHKIKLPRTFFSLKRRIKSDLIDKTGNIKGILIEDKGLSLSVHFRMVNKREIKTVERLLKGIFVKYKGLLKVRKGKCVYEIGPDIDWDKGKAVTWIMNRFGRNAGDHAPIYIGDDATDEDAFRALKGKGLTVLVGRGTRSNAEYSLRNTSDVRRFLGKLGGLYG